MKYILGLSAAFALALTWLPATGCCQPPPPHTPAHQFGGFPGQPVQPQHPQSPGGGIQQYPGSTEMPPSQPPGGGEFQPPVQHHSPGGEIQSPVPDSGPIQ